MGTLLKVVGVIWALIGLANLIGMPWTENLSGLLTFGLMFNMLLFVIPGLVVYGIGAGIKKRQAASTEVVMNKSTVAPSELSVEEQLNKLNGLKEKGPTGALALNVDVIPMRGVHKWSSKVYIAVILVVGILVVMAYKRGYNRSAAESEAMKDQQQTSPVAMQKSSSLEIRKNSIKGKLLSNGEYTIENGETVKLANGKFEKGRSVVELKEFSLGDIDNNGVEDAVVILSESSEGSGCFYRLIALINREGNFQQKGALLQLGDRIIVNSVIINNGIITVDMVTHGPEDASCCPTIRELAQYRLIENNLIRLKEAVHPKPLPQEKKDEAPVKAVNDFNCYDVEKYCQKLSSVSGSSYMIENSCREMERESQNNLIAMQIPEEIYSYCRRLGNASGGSYMLMESCVKMEIEAKNNLR